MPGVDSVHPTSHETLAVLPTDKEIIATLPHTGSGTNGHAEPKRIYSISKNREYYDLSGVSTEHTDVYRKHYCFSVMIIVTYRQLYNYRTCT